MAGPNNVISDFDLGLLKFFHPSPLENFHLPLYNGHQKHRLELEAKIKKSISLFKFLKWSNFQVDQIYKLSRIYLEI